MYTREEQKKIHGIYEYYRTNSNWQKWFTEDDIQEALLWFLEEKREAFSWEQERLNAFFAKVCYNKFQTKRKTKNRRNAYKSINQEIIEKNVYSESNMKDEYTYLIRSKQLYSYLEQKAGIDETAVFFLYNDPNQKLTEISKKLDIPYSTCVNYIRKCKGLLKNMLKLTDKDINDIYKYIKV